MQPRKSTWDANEDEIVTSPSTPAAAPLLWQARRLALLASVSLAAVAAAIAAPQPAAAKRQPPMFSQGWLQQRAQLQAQAARREPARAQSRLNVNARQRQQIERSNHNLSRAGDALRAQLRGQTAARLAASNLPNVLDGLTPTDAGGEPLPLPGGTLPGLTPYPGVRPDVDDARGIIWSGAQLPSERRKADGAVEVKVKQTAEKALITWKDFNIGRKTTLSFDQRSRDWVVFNRVLAGEPAADGSRFRPATPSPSRILGAIKAPGEVYVVNQNGIIFYDTAQVSTGSLIASALDIGRTNMRLTQRNAYFFNPPAHELSFSFQYRVVDEINRGQLREVGVIDPEAANWQTSPSLLVGSGPFPPRIRPVFLAADAVEGDVEVRPGAVLETNRVGRDGRLGRIALIAPNVRTEGLVSSPDGQVILAASRNVTLYSNTSERTTGPDVDPTLRGAAVRIGLADGDSETVGSIAFPIFPNLPFSLGGDAPSIVVSETSPLAHAGTVSNSGLVAARRGNITIRANQVELYSGSVLQATTSVNAPGSITVSAQHAQYLDAPPFPPIGVLWTGTPATKAARLRVAGDAVVTILPDTERQADGSRQTLPAASRETFRRSVIELSVVNDFVGNAGGGGQAGFFDRRTPLAPIVPGFPPIQIATVSPNVISNGAPDGAIVLERRSLIVAPSASLTLRGTRVGGPAAQVTPNVVVERGADIDVSGLMAVPARVSDNLVLVDVARVGLNELADSPLQRDGFLYRRSAVIDRRIRGVRNDGSEWVGTPLFDASSYVGAVGLPVEHLMTRGGSITIDVASAVIRRDAMFNIAGGYIDYRGGVLATTRLVTADGRRTVDIADADPNVRYGGRAGRFVVQHDRWGQTDVFRDALLSTTRQRFENGYVEGADAGSFTVAAPARTVPGSLVLFDGDIAAGAIAGPYQRVGSLYPSERPRGGRIDFSGAFSDTLTFSKRAADNVPDGYQSGEAIDFAIFRRQRWSTDRLNATGAEVLTFGSAFAYSATSNIAPVLPDGGSLQPQVLFTADADLRLPAGGRLSVTGQEIDVFGRICATAGELAFTLTSIPNAPGVIGEERARFTLHNAAVLDVAGAWVNDTAAGRDRFVGADFINGGTVSVTSSTIPAGGFIPESNTIEISNGSTIELSSGGHVATNGQLDRTASGVPRGRGGNLELLLHPDGSSDLTSGTGNRPSVVPVDDGGREQINDSLVIGDQARIIAYGFAGGGRFALRAPRIDIGGDRPVSGDGGTMRLPETFFTQGFGSYHLTALLTASVDERATITLRQPQYQALPGAGLARSLDEAATVGFNQGTQRVPVDLALASRAFATFQAGAFDSATAKSALRIGSGARILGEPGSEIALGAHGTLTIDGTLRAPGGTIRIANVAAQTSTAAGDVVQTLDGAGVFLLDNAQLDARGAFRVTPDLPFRSGELLPGGTVAVSAANLIARAGSVVDVSGATAVLDLPIHNGADAPRWADLRRRAVSVASEAGSIGLTVGGTTFSGQIAAGRQGPLGIGLMDGSLLARPGAAGVAGGRLVLTSGAVAFTHRRLQRTAGIAPGDAMPADLPSDLVIIATEMLNGSGIDSIVTNADVVGFSGATRLRANRQIMFNDLTRLSVVPEGFALLGGRDAAVGAPVLASVTAPYIALRGRADRWAGLAGETWSPAGLHIDGGTVDIAGAVTVLNMHPDPDRGRGEEALRLSANDDIRFIPSLLGDGTRTLRALLRANSDIVLEATQVYPASGVEAIIQSARDGGVVRFIGRGKPGEKPLSAGGGLTVSASHVRQDGVVRAPFGSLRFGVTELSTGLAALIPEADFRATQSVVFSAGSETSVSGRGLRVPYGRTENLRDWFYDALASLDASSQLSSAPTKAIRADAATATLARGATLDLSGGGEIYASEWIPGLGGSRNVLATSTTSDADGPVYALLPAYRAKVAPVDLVELGNPADASDPAFNDIGRTLTTLRDLPGLPAGTYVLLPGAYATLPGAFRVQQLPGTADTAAGTRQRLDDGTFVVAGRLGLSSGSRDARTAAFTVQPAAVWRQYSEIQSSGGSAFFAARARRDGNAPAPLPIDAGRLTLVVSERFELGADLVFRRPRDGRGGQVDLAAPRLQVGDAGSPVLPDYTLVTPDDVHGLNAQSVLLGGVRLSEAAGERIDVVASDITVRTTAGDPLANAELILVAGDGVVVEPGSVVRSGSRAATDAAPDLLLDGDSALLRLSDRSPVAVVRRGDTGATGVIEIDAGTTLGGGQTLQIDASSDAAIDPAAIFSGTAIDLSSGRINLLPDGDLPGASISAATLQRLAGAEQLSLRAREAITFYRPLAVAAAGRGPRLKRLTLSAPNLVGDGLGGGAVVLDAAAVVLTSEQPRSGGEPAGAAGLLQVTADTVVLSGADRALSGFDQLTVEAARRVRFGDGASRGTLSVPGAVTLSAPLMEVASGADQRLVSANDGLVALLGGSSGDRDGDALDAVGGRLAIDGGTILVDTRLAARSGELSLRSRAGDVRIGDDGSLIATGYRQEFVDTAVVLPGGKVSLQSDMGNIVLADGGRIDVSADTGGHAGTLELILGSGGGSARLGGAVHGEAGGSTRDGGRLVVRSRGGVALNDLAALADRGGFTGGLAVASGEGDLVLSRELVALRVLLSAEAGRVVVSSTIDASGAAGGRIELYGGSGVSLGNEARLRAVASDDDERGGQVVIGTDAAGGLDLSGGAIDVAGGADYGSSGGTVHLRTPFAGDPAAGSIGATTLATRIDNAAALILEPFQRVDVGAAPHGGVIGDAEWATLFDAFTPNTAAIESAFAALPSLRVTPGLELVNGNVAVNSGDITITGVLDLASRRYGASGTMPGILTVRAAGDLRIDGTISDGFSTATPAGNLFDWADGSQPPPLSWSYTLTAGARLPGVNPHAVELIDTFESGALADRGNFLFGAVPTMAGAAPLGGNDLIRTGTGRIHVSAGGRGLGERRTETAFQLSEDAIEAGFHVDPDAAVLFLSPTAVLYTAGVNAPPEPGFVDGRYLGSRDYTSFVATNPFDVGRSPGVFPSRVGLRANRPAFATAGGDIRIDAPNGAIVAQQHHRDAVNAAGVAILTTQPAPSVPLVYAGQLFTPWLLGQGASSNTRGSGGVFGGDGRQSARWVLTGAFQQGVAAMGGGDVAIAAGGDVRDLSLSIISTYRAVDGKTLDQPPQLRSYGGGALTIESGGDIGSIITLVDEGRARIAARGSLTASYQQPIVYDAGLGQVSRSRPLASMIFLGDSVVDIVAGGAVTLETIGQPDFPGYPFDVIGPPDLSQPPMVAPPTPFAGSGQGAHVGPSLSYGTETAVVVTAASGDLRFGATDIDFLYRYGGQETDELGRFEPDGEFSYLPPSVRFAAVRGDMVLRDDMVLAPAPRGNFEALAFASLSYYRAVPENRAGEGRPISAGIKLIDADPREMVGPLLPRSAPVVGLGIRDATPPISGSDFTGDRGYRLDDERDTRFSRRRLHASIDDRPLHAGDPEPARLIALSGDLINGNNPDDPGDPTTESFRYFSMPIYLNKPATIAAGGDILNLDFIGHNNSVTDVTLIRSGGAMTYDLGFVIRTVTGTQVLQPRGGSFTICGIGQFVIQAGADLRLRPSEPGSTPSQASTPYGVLGIGNRINPVLPAASADITVSFGTGRGIDVSGFVQRYINPAGELATLYQPMLVTFMERWLTAVARETDPDASPVRNLSADQAWQAFQGLTSNQQLQLVQQVLYTEVRTIADPVRFPEAYQDFDRVYAAIDALFPAALGYTDNLGGRVRQVTTGDLEMINATLRSEFGGDINLLGPGGRALIGGLASPAGLTPNVQGILTLRGGSINAVLDDDFNVFSSRVLTLQGGDVTIFSGNGNIDAGRGRAGVSFFPPLVTLYDPATTAVSIDFAGLVTGAGIGTLLSVPGVEAGDVYLVAPRGDIDAGEAGIRAAGDLSLVAVQVINAENVQVGGQTTGLAVVATTAPVSTVSAAATAQAAAAATESPVTDAGAGGRQRQVLPSIITVEVLGYGEPGSRLPGIAPATGDEDDRRGRNER